jgi:hypothetical protein
VSDVIISDEVVEAALIAAGFSINTHTRSAKNTWMRAAITAAIIADRASDERVRAEREACAKIAKVAWLTSDTGTIGNADYGEALCNEIFESIRSRSSGEGA